VQNQTIVPVKAENRVLVAEGRGGSLPRSRRHIPSSSPRGRHQLGYVWYRKDAAGRFGLGIRQADREESALRRELRALQRAAGTWQQMAVYFYVSPDSGEATRQSVLAFTHGDTFKPVPATRRW